MNKDKTHKVSMIQQLQKWPFLLRHPVRFIEETKEESINWIQLGFLYLWVVICNYREFSQGKGSEIAITLAVSIGLMVCYLVILAIIGGGKKKIKVLFNLSVYIHFFYVLINMAYHTRIMIFLMAVFAVCHLYLLVIHYQALVKWLECSRERLRVVISAEVTIIVMGFINLLMFYAGRCMIYSTKIFHFPYS